MSSEDKPRKVPRLLVPDTHFAALDLRDRDQERSFLAKLKEVITGGE